MFNQRSLVVVLILLMFLAPLAQLLENSEITELSDSTVNESSTLNGWPDIPTWRIGDKYTYETLFDVQDLIEQADVEASLNTLTGDTTYTVSDIFFINIDGIQTLVYKMDIEGFFTSGDDGATFDDTPLGDVDGTLDITYTGEDIIRVRDLAVVNSEFSLDVLFRAFNSGFSLFHIDVATISFDTSYNPPKEKYDFPLHVGDQWYMEFDASTDVDGQSDYFDPSEFDTAGPENNSWQITANGIPTEDGINIGYTGCDDSYKINEWNVTGVNQGFNWYCPDVRYNSWMRISNAAGFTIDWLLKSYEPAGSSGFNANSNPGNRDVEIDIGLQGIATLPNVEQTISIDYGDSGSNPLPNTNLQLRYEMAGTLLNPTTDVNGQATEVLNSSNVVDDTNSSDDFSSNGLIVWDPQADIIGAATIVIDLSLTPVDLIAQTEAIIVTRTRDGVDSILSKSIGYNTLPGDIISFSIPTQNRGLLASNATSIQVTTPNGAQITEPLPSIPAYGESRIDVQWIVPQNEPIGVQNLLIEVDPDNLVPEDSNRTNNQANVEIFIGRAPTASVVVVDDVYTFENVTIDASASFDEDSGEVTCKFSVERSPGLVDNFDSEDCIIEYNWSDGGMWNVEVTVIDNELDEDILDVKASVKNRAPYINISVVDSINVNNYVSINAEDSGDIDTISPSGQEVRISWPGLNCEGITFGPICTILVTQEGTLEITAVAEDDDGATTAVSTTIDVLNVAPSLAQPELWRAGQNQSTDELGYWNLNEDETVILRAVAEDTPLDKESLIIEWKPSDLDDNWTITTVGPSSQTAISWPSSGLHTLTVVAYDNDNAKSTVRSGVVNITNLPPTIEPLGSTQPIFEDNNITFTAEVADTVSDLENLVVCWDLDSLVDADEDGDAENDCDISGLEMTASWPTSGLRLITATVTDDDGASASTSINVSVINSAPRAKITNSTNVMLLNEGDNVTLSGLTTTDTAFDKLSLVYAWDSNHIDSDLDGDKIGDVDHYGAEWLINDLPPGTWTITLTVTDDDGESNTKTIEIAVKPKPSEGFLESVTDAVGGVGTLVIAILGIVVIGLGAFLILTRNSGNKPEKYSDFNLPINSMSQFSEPISTPSADAGFGLYQQDNTATDQYATYNPAPQSDNITVTTTQPTQVAEQGPPLPATGLPEGWTMDQWQYYGEQYLATQTASKVQNQPTNTDTTTQSTTNFLDNVLDDLDL